VKIQIKFEDLKYHINKGKTITGSMRFTWINHPNKVYLESSIGLLNLYFYKNYRFGMYSQLIVHKKHKMEKDIPTCHEHGRLHSNEYHDYKEYINSCGELIHDCVPLNDDKNDETIPWSKYGSYIIKPKKLIKIKNFYVDPWKSCRLDHKDINILKSSTYVDGENVLQTLMNKNHPNNTMYLYSMIDLDELIKDFIEDQRFREHPVKYSIDKKSKSQITISIENNKTKWIFYINYLQSLEESIKFKPIACLRSVWNRKIIGYNSFIRSIKYGICYNIRPEIIIHENPIDLYIKYFKMGFGYLMSASDTKIFIKHLKLMKLEYDLVKNPSYFNYDL